LTADLTTMPPDRRAWFQKRQKQIKERSNWVDGSIFKLLFVWVRELCPISNPFDVIFIYVRTMNLFEFFSLLSINIWHVCVAIWPRLPKTRWTCCLNRWLCYVQCATQTDMRMPACPRLSARLT
jgi:hypothetical protein